MGIEPVHHFFTDLWEPNRAPSEILNRKISILGWKSFACSVIEKICYVAFLAIVGVILSLSYIAAPLSERISMTLAGLALGTPLLGFSFKKFSQLSSQYFKEQEMEKGVLEHLRQIEAWKTAEITAYLREERVIPEQISLDPLRATHPQEPFCALLPLIARYRYLKEESTKAEAHLNLQRNQLEENFARQEADARAPIPPLVKYINRFECTKIVADTHEKEAVPLAIKAMALLQLIQNPNQEIDIEPFSLEIKRIGSCVPRDYASRLFGRNDRARNDDYFFFRKELNREPIALEAIERNMDPKDLRLLFFPI